MSETAKELTEKSLQCLHLSRSLADQYPDATKIPAEVAKQRDSLLAEANRLRGLAETQRREDDLSSWASSPDQEHPAVTSTMKASMDALSANIAGQQNAAFLNWVRKGDRELVAKADLVEDGTGEIIVPHDITGPIFKTLPHLGIFRGAGPLVRPTTSNKVDVRSLTNAAVGWGKLELGATATDANVVPNSPADVVTVWDLVALSRVGVDELADTDANLSALIQEIVGLKMAEAEDDAFAAGSGTSRPWGLATRATGGLITNAVTAATTQTVSGDELKKLPYQVGSRFRINGAYFASNDATQAIALLKDANSNYLWQPSVRAGEPDTLFGRRFYTLEGLPAMNATTTAVDPSVIFGDPGLGYMVADRQQITMQRLDERYAELGLVGFLFKMRVGGDVIRPAAFAKYLL